MENFWRRLRWPVLLVAGVFAYGVAGYVVLEGWTLIDAFYMTLTTLTTVGFGEVQPLDTGGKIFTSSLIILGVVVVVVTLSLVAGWVAEANLGERSRRRRMERRIEGLENHYIICAYGRVGRTVAREFEGQGAAFVVIDAKEDLEEQMIRDGVAFMIGDPSLEPVLRAAGVERARGLVCAVDSDATNVYITLMARSLNPGIFIVARASESYSAERLYKAGSDRVISPYVASGRHMALLALRPRVVDYLEMATEGARPVRVEELLIEESSPLVGRTVGETCGQAAPLAVRHPNGEISANPPLNLRLRQGDLLVLLGEETVLRPVEEG